jgi:hypothetical protein
MKVKQQMHDELLQHVTDSAALVDQLSMRKKATRAILKPACLCTASAGGHFKHKATLIHTSQITLNM